MDTTKANRRLKKPPLPLDHGWAWFVMLGSFLNLSCLMLFIRASSVLFIEFLSMYGASATATTLAFGLCATMFAFSSILTSSIFLPKFKVRTLSLVGSVLNFASIVGIAFSPNIVTLNVLFALLGTSHGIMGVPQTYLIGQYFKKRLSFANAFANLGLGVATSVGPPFCRILLETYGLRGAVMMMAALNLNCFVGSMLFRPLSNYTLPGDLDMDEEDDCAEGGSIQHHSNKVGKAGISGTTDDTFLQKNISQNGSKGDEPKSDADPVSATHLETGVGKGDSPHSSLLVVPDSLPTQDTNATSPLHAQIHPEDPEDHPGMWARSLDTLSLSSSIRYLSNPNLYTQGVTTAQNTYSRARARTLSTSRPEKLDSHSQKTSHYNDHKDTHSLTAKGQLPALQNSYCCPCFRKVLAVISKSVFANPVAILLLAGCGIGHHMQSVIAYMPAAGQEIGLSPEQTPLLLTVLGVVDLVSKLSVGIVADLGYVPRVYIVAFTQSLLGVTLQFLRFVRGFGAMMAYQVCVGYVLGVMQIFTPVLVVDYLGAQHIPAMMSTYFLVVGIISAADHLIVGSFKDATGSFFSAYHYMGALSFLSTFVFIALPVVARYNKSKAQGNKRGPA